MEQRAPGWVDVPGIGRRYWTGKEYRFYGPSSDPNRGGRNEFNMDLSGMYNNFLQTNFPTAKLQNEVGRQSYERNPGEINKDGYFYKLLSKKDSSSKKAPPEQKTTPEENPNQNLPSDPIATEVVTSTLEKNRPLNSDGGLDTKTGTKFESFQAQQQDLMDRRAGLRTPYSAEGVDLVGDVDPRTAALIRGIPRDPFSSTQLPLTEMYSENAPQFDTGIDPSKMLERAKNINFSETVEGLTDFSKTLGLRDTYSSNYVSPVNFNAMQSSGDPMLNPDIDVATAMQMKNRDAGLMYASGQFFAEGEGGQPVLVNRQLAKDVRSGKEGAQAKLDAYLAGGGIKPQGGVIYDPKMEQMVPPKAEETQITPTPGQSANYPSISTADFTNTGAFDPNISSSFFGEEPELPDMSKKLGISYKNPAYTDLFSRKADIFDPFSSEYNPYMFKD